MIHILIADAGKSSLVMTSEVFKEKLPGCFIHFVKTGKECFEIEDLSVFSMIVVDFDLPDADGVSLTKMLRNHYQGPIILTAFDEPVVQEAIDKELFFYHDSCMWVKKPVRSDQLAEKIDLFIIQKRSIRKRFIADISTTIVGKASGRGRRAPKVKGQISDISISGARVTLESSLKMKVGEEIVLTLQSGLFVPHSLEANENTIDEQGISKIPSRIKGRIAWSNRKSGQTGIEFENLTETSKEYLETLLKNSNEIELDLNSR